MSRAPGTTVRSILVRGIGVLQVCTGIAIAAPVQTPSQALAQGYAQLWTMAGAPGGLLVVHPAGDLDQDGWNDVLVGEPWYNAVAGRLGAYSGASGSLMWETLGSQSIGPSGSPPGESMGNAMAVLDWDGNGVSDVVVAAPKFANSAWPSFQQGRVRVVRGGDGSTLAELWVPPGLQGSSMGGEVLAFGSALGVGGDLSGDGFEDLVVCVSKYLPTSLGFNSGAVVAFEAPTGNIVSTINGSVPEESPGSFSAYPDIGGALILPGTGSGALGRIVFGSPVRNALTPTGALQYFWAGSLKVYDAGGGTPLLEVIGTGNYRQVGYQVAGHEDLDGDGYPDFAVLREPYMLALTGGMALANPVVEVYSGSSLQILYSKQVLAAPGLWPVRYVGLTPDVSGDGLADILVSSTSGFLVTGVTAYTWTKIYEGDTGTEVEAWLFGDPNYAFTGYAGYESRVVGDVNNDGWGDLGVVRRVIGTLGLSTPSPLEIFGRRNLAVTGSLTPGGQATLTIQTPKHGSRPYLFLFSGGAGPPVPVGPYLIPLAADPLLTASIDIALTGVLDASGQGSATIPIPNDQGLVGATVYASGVVADPSSAYGLGTILTRAAVSIQ